MKKSLVRARNHSMSVFPPVPIDDKKLLQEVRQWLDKIYPEGDAEEDEEIDAYREAILTLLQILQNRILTLTERERVGDLIAQWRTIVTDDIEPILVPPNTSESQPAHIFNIFSQLRLETNTSLHVGNISIVLNQIRQVVESNELTPKEAAPLRVLMDNYLTLHYVDERYASVKVLDKTMLFSSRIINNLVVVEKSLQERKEERLLKEETRARHGFDNSFIEHYEDIYRYYQKEHIDTKDIFKLNEKEQAANKQAPKRILIHGRAGIGKSTLCQQICYEWAYGRLWRDKFEWVIGYR